jgi:DNA (cytosine-5)-methyltransferase 1
MRYLSLFSGIGGFDLALSRYGHQCIGFSEIEHHAVEVYEKHFPEVPNYGDITQIKEKELPEFELLCGGFPCQSFSMAGKRRGFKDRRGQLFFDIARIVGSKRPEVVFLENVRGLLTHEGGRTFRRILDTLCKLGYCVEWQVLDSANFAIPQHRERVFIIGHRRDKLASLIFPIEPTTTGSISGLQIHNEYKYDRRNVIYDVSGIAPTLTVQDSRHTLLSIGRALTPVEAERLQGFPDGWTEGFSDHRRFAMLGNAVTVAVVEEIAKRL